MKIDFSKLLTGNGIESLRNGKNGINLEIIEEVSIEKSLLPL